MKVKQLIEILRQYDQELDVWVMANNGDDLDFSEECEFISEAYLDDSWGPLVYEEDEKPEGQKVLLIS